MNIFGDGLGDQGAADADEEWPPFRKVRPVIRLAQFVSSKRAHRIVVVRKGL